MERTKRPNLSTNENARSSSVILHNDSNVAYPKICHIPNPTVILTMSRESGCSALAWRLWMLQTIPRLWIVCFGLEPWPGTTCLRHLTLTVPLSTRVFKSVPANLIGDVSASHPGKSRKTRKKPGLHRHRGGKPLKRLDDSEYNR